MHEVVRLYNFAALMILTNFSPLGEVLLWEERCRIKHLPTRLYLTVQKSGDTWKVSAFSSHYVPASVWDTGHCVGWSKEKGVLGQRSRYTVQLPLPSQGTHNNVET